MTQSSYVRSLFIAAAAVLLLADVAAAADQIEQLTKVPEVLMTPENYVSVTKGDMTVTGARNLFSAVFPQEDVESPDFYGVIHVLVWGDDTSKIEQSRWYIYRGRGNRASYGGTWTAQRFRGSRIFGTDRLALLYLHVNVPAAARVDAEAELAPQLAKAAKPGVAALSVTDLLPANAEPATTVRSSRRQALRRLGSYIVETAYTRISYRLEVTKKLPAPIQNLQDALGILEAAAPAEPFVTLKQRVGLYAGQVYDILHVPSDITVSGEFAPTLDTKKDLGKQTYDNEGLYYWDVSLAIPIRSIKQLNFETSGGDVFAKEVDKAQLMGLVNFFWRPIDTKNAKLLLSPSPIIGVALSTNPLEKVLVGLSLGLTRVQVYGGRQWTQVDKPPVPVESAAPPDAKTREYKADWMFGINVPVRQVVDFLKNKK